MSRDSIRSVQSRINSPNATIPIEFRTLSFQVSASQDVNEARHKQQQRSPKGHKKLLGFLPFALPSKETHHEPNKAARTFATANEHSCDAGELCIKLRVSPQVGLSNDAAAKRLQFENKR